MDEPTYKSPAIESLLTSITGISRQDAMRLGICTWCKGPVSQFKDVESRKEYCTSGMCQNCQDQTFGGGEDE
jgi:hypothetical protein